MPLGSIPGIAQYFSRYLLSFIFFGFNVCNHLISSFRMHFEGSIALFSLSPQNLISILSWPRTQFGCCCNRISIIYFNFEGELVILEIRKNVERIGSIAEHSELDHHYWCILPTLFYHTLSRYATLCLLESSDLFPSLPLTINSSSVYVFVSPRYNNRTMAFPFLSRAPKVRGVLLLCDPYCCSNLGSL